jgi:hypothetical protein
LVRFSHRGRMIRAVRMEAKEKERLPNRNDTAPLSFLLLCFCSKKAADR